MTASRGTAADPRTRRRPRLSTASGASWIDREAGGQQAVRPRVEQVLLEPVLPDHPQGEHGGEDERVGEEGGDLASPHDAGSDDEQRHVGEDERQLLEREVELERVVQVARVEHHAEERAGQEDAQRRMDPRPLEAWRDTTARRERQQPRTDEEGQHEPVEPHVDRQRGVELDRVERNEPQHGQEQSQHPRQDARRAGPVVVVRFGPVAGEPLAQRLQAGRGDVRGPVSGRRANPPTQSDEAGEAHGGQGERDHEGQGTDHEGGTAVHDTRARLAQGPQHGQPGLGHALLARDRAQVVA